MHKITCPGCGANEYPDLYNTRPELLAKCLKCEESWFVSRAEFAAPERLTHIVLTEKEIQNIISQPSKTQNMSTIRGTITEILPVEQAGQYQKRIVAIETHEDYPQTLGVEFFGDKGLAMAANLRTGEDVEVSINIKGRRWQKTPADKVVYFVSLSAWKVEKLNGEPKPTTTPSHSVQHAYTQPAYTPPPAPPSPPANDDLPF